MNSAQLNILQWNCRSLNSKIGDLCNLLSYKNIDVVCLSETWRSHTDTSKIPNYSLLECFSPPASNGVHYGGVAIALKSNYIFSRIHIPFNCHPFQVVGCKLTCGTKIISILSIYVAPDKPYSVDNTVNMFKELLKLCSEYIIITGDFNAHSPVWGDSRNDAKGLCILDVLDQCNLFLLNNGLPTRFNALDQPSAIDLTFSSPNLGIDCQWSTFNDTLNSDHVPIVINILLISRPSILNRDISRVCTPKNFDSSRYKNNLLKVDYNYLSSLHSSDALNELNKAMVLACSPQTYSKNKKLRSSPVWWTPVCSKAVALRRKAFSLYKSRPSRLNYDNLKVQERETKYILQLEKKKGWQTFCSEINPSMKINHIFNRVKSFKGSQAPKQIIDPTVLNRFTSIVTGPIGPISKPPDLIPFVPSKSSSHLLNSFSQDELKLALKSRKNSAPGQDGIRYKMLIDLPCQAMDLLLNIFNDILSTAITPASWNNFLTIPILKPGKDASLASSFRPIALASCVRKTFERLLKFRIEYFFETYALLPHHQHGFRKGRTTTNSITSLWAKLKLNLTSKRISFVTFFDIKGAFDNVRINILMDYLNESGVPPIILKLIYNLFASSNITVSHMDFISETMTAILGLRQGTILAPLFFIFLVSKVGISLPSHSNLTTFADDFVIITSADSILEARQNTQTAADIISKDLINLGLEISVEKTKVLIVSGKPFNNLNCIPPIRLNNVNIPFVNQAKFLGFTLTYNLKPNVHINSIVNKTSKLINILRAIAGTWWGADPRSMIMLYKSLIRPVIDYACFIYDDAPKDLILKLNRVQWKALRLSLGAMQSTHTRAIEVEANVMPLESRRQLLADRFLVSQFKYSNNETLKSLEELYHVLLQIQQQNKILIVKRFQTIKSFHFHSFNTHIVFQFSYESIWFKPKVFFLNNFANKRLPFDPTSTFNLIIEKYWHLFNHIYTDGSKNAEKTAAAAWLPFIQIEAGFSLHNLTTIFTAEACAIMEALLLINSLEPDRYLIISDSKSCLDSLAALPNSSSHPIIFLIKNKIFELTIRNYDIVLLWVPGHCNIVGNEQADQIAKNVTAYSDIPHIYPFDLLSWANREAVLHWQHIWNTSPFGRRFYSLKSIVGKKSWFDTINLDRSSIVSICRIRFGHVRANDHLFKIKIVESRRCECNLSEDSIDHTLFECILGEGNLRRSFIRELRFSYSITNPNTLHLLNTNNPNVYRTLASYLKRGKFLL